MHRVTLTQKSLIERQAHTRPRLGFTLVELLVVLVIIGMLASMVSFAMFRSMQAAREAKTQALISKIHGVIARHWDTFETGQPPSNMTVAAWMADEMPCTENEFNQSTLFSNTLGLSVSATDADAQCLYQIVLQLADDDLDRINLFSENETRDISDPKDGTPDIFIDAWGQPIHFVRQPTGFTDSDINDPTALNSLTGGTGLYFPLIYSRGSDKTKGLADETGIPSGNEHLDNIHNHRMNARLQ